MKFHFVFALFTLFTISTSALSADPQIYWMKIAAENKFQRSEIANSGAHIEFIGEDFVIATGTQQELDSLRNSQNILSSFSLTKAMDFPTQDSDYHNYTELSQKLSDLNKQYPQLTQLTSLGKSYEGRDIWLLTISSNISNAQQLPALAIMGGHHAREHLSVEVPLLQAEQLLKSYNNGDSRIRGLIDSRVFYFIPAVNPDGLEYDISDGRYKMWRKNRRDNQDGTFGVDLNRNYGFQWGTGGSSSSTRSDTYKGPQEFSEPETQAIKRFVTEKQNISILLTYHTFSELILYPWGHRYEGIQNSNDKRVHELMAQKMSTWNNYTPQQSSELYQASGDTTDWSYGSEKVISFTFELDPKSQWGTGGFYPGGKIINNVVQKNWEPLLYLADYADNPYRVLNPTISPLPGAN